MGVKRSLVDVNGPNGLSAFLSGGGGIVFLSNPGEVPSPALPDVLYINNSDNVLFYGTPDGKVFTLPLTSGTGGGLLANAFSISDNTVTTTTQSIFQTKLTFSEPFKDGLHIVLVSYGWNHNDTTSDFEGRLLLNNVQQGETHKEESQDSSGTFGATGTDQKRYLTRVHILPLKPSDILDLQFRSSAAGVESSMFDASITTISLAGLG